MDDYEIALSEFDKGIEICRKLLETNFKGEKHGRI